MTLVPSDSNDVQPPTTAASGRPLRALFLNDTSRNGGPGRTLATLLAHFDPAQVHRSVILPREGVVAELLRSRRLADELSFENHFVENLIEPWDRAISRADFDAPLLLRVGRAAGNTVRAAQAIQRLAAMIRRSGTEVLFCNGTSANFAGAALGALTGVNVVWHVFYTSVAPVIAPLHRQLAASRSVRSILCVSEPTSRMFEHCRHKVQIVHDSIDLEEYSPRAVTPCLRQELQITDDTVVFLSQGRILRSKGYVEMIQAVDLAAQQMTPGERHRTRFVVLGDTPEDRKEDHLETCRALVRDKHLEDLLQFIGYRPSVMPYLAGCDVVVVPSIYEDPLPRAVLEGMAMAKPVLAFSVGGIPEMVADGKTGALSAGHPPDVAAMSRAFLAYLRQPTLRTEHGQRGRARALAEFDSRLHGRRVQEELIRVASLPH